MASVLVPVLYVVLVFGSLFLFSSWYRKRAASSYLYLIPHFSIHFYVLLTCRTDRLTEPYFLSHPDRDLYVTLLGRTDPPTNDALLKAALVRRAMADVQRVLKIREDKPALQNLLQKGSVGDDLWNSLLAAERELEAEVMEVIAEANTFVEGWGTVIFQTANEMIANEKMRALFEQNADIRREKGARPPESWFNMCLHSLDRTEIWQIETYKSHRCANPNASSHIIIFGSITEYTHSHNSEPTQWCCVIQCRHAYDTRISHNTCHINARHTFKSTFHPISFVICDADGSQKSGKKGKKRK